MALLPFEVRDSIDSYYQTDEISDFLGHGTFADVYKAVCIRDDISGVQHGQTVALKVIQKNHLSSEKMIQDTINEVEILRFIDHSNCIRLLDCFQTMHHVVIVMAYVPGKELLQTVIDVHFTEAMVRSVMSQILSTLAYLHGNLLVVHRDIKPENVLITLLENGSLHVTLVDFGLARKLRKQNTTSRRIRGDFAPVQRLARLPLRSCSTESFGEIDSPFLATPCGTLKYAAPETVKSISQSNQLQTTRELLPRVDMYAAGILMYVMLCGALPFSNFSNKVALYREMEAGPSFTGPRWENKSAAAIELNKALLCKDPKRRPAAEEAMRAMWFMADSQCGVNAGQMSTDGYAGDDMCGGGSTGAQQLQQQQMQPLPVDEALGKPDYALRAFDAIKCPEDELYP